MGFKSVERVKGWNDKDLNIPNGTGFELLGERYLILNYFT
jgi:hypothetical protein